MKRARREVIQLARQKVALRRLVLTNLIQGCAQSLFAAGHPLPRLRRWLSCIGQRAGILVGIDELTQEAAARILRQPL